MSSFTSALRRAVHLGVCAGLLSGLMPGGAAAQSPAARIIVKLRTGTELATVSARQAAQGVPSAELRPMHRLGQSSGIPLTDGRQLAPGLHVATASGISASALAARLSARSDVEYAVVDGWRRPTSVSEPTDPYFGSPASLPAGQWYLRAPTGVFRSAINATSAWSQLQSSLGAVGSADVVVAVLDTGVRFDHPDLANKLISPGYSMVAEGTRAGYPGGGRTASASDLGDWLTQAEITANPTLYKDCEVQSTSSWHGTKVAGILGAQSDNGVGMASVAWAPRLLPVRVLAKCGGYDSDIIAGMRWAAGLSVPGVTPLSSTQTARVINLSLGGEGSCSLAYRDVISQLAARNVVVVSSSGNGYGEAVSAPGNCPGVITVAGLRHAGTKVDYSALGPEVTVSAPSGNCLSGIGACAYPILTTVNTGATTPVAGSAGADYSSGERPTYGTSFAAPQVSGALALMLSQRPGLTPAAMAQLLRNTARPFPAPSGGDGVPQCTAPASGVRQDECHCTDATCGAGMLDVGQAVAAVDGAVAVISTGNSVLAPGRTITLSGAGSLPSVPAAGVARYEWTLLEGGGIVTALAGDANAVSMTAVPSAAGSFKVRLAVTDDRGATSVSDYRVHIASLDASTAGPPSSGGGGGGGGAIDPSWLAAWALLLGAGLCRPWLRESARSR